MPIQQHLQALQAKHKALESTIAERLSHPSCDDLEIRQLKAEKLRLKDQIVHIAEQLFLH